MANEHNVQDTDVTTVSLDGLKRYHHEVCGALGLEQDTLKYSYEFNNTNPGHDGEKITITDQTVGDSLDDLYESTNIMCENAKKYYEKQFHGLFNATWDGGARSGPTGKAYTKSDAQVATTTTLTATFTPGSYSVTYIDENGTTQTTDVDTEFVKGSDNNFYTSVTSGWTIKTNTKDKIVATKTVTKHPGTDAGFATDQSIDSEIITLTAKVYTVDPVTRQQTTLTETFTETGTASYSVSCTDNWGWPGISNEIWDVINGSDSDASAAKLKEIFDNTYKTIPTTYSGSKTFKITVGSSEKNAVDNSWTMTLSDEDPVTHANRARCIFWCTRDGVTFKQLSNNTIVKKGSITTRFGKYYYYITGACACETFKYAIG